MRKHLIYLASGSSRRFGSNKLLHEVSGKPMFRHGLEILKAVAADRGDCTVTVVSRYAVIREAAAEMGFRGLDSPDSEKGISHTIRAGIKALGQVSPEDCLLFLVADQPWLTPESVRRLLAAAETGTDCACLQYKGRPGNPTLFSARLIPELLALTGDTGGRAVLRRHPCTYVEAASLEELEDIDTQ